MISKKVLILEPYILQCNGGYFQNEYILEVIKIVYI